MPGGVPRYIRCWDTGNDEYADRYTVVYCGRYRTIGIPKHTPYSQYPWFQYVGMSADLSVCQHGESPNIIDCPEGWTEQLGRKCRHNPALGRRIAFTDLPVACQAVVVDDYCELWGLPNPAKKIEEPA